LAIEIMLVHRRIDLECNKKEKGFNGSWIRGLKEDAEHLVKSKPAQIFSSARYSAFTEAMKARALNEIFPR
jgi:hypothetical protein